MLWQGMDRGTSTTELIMFVQTPKYIPQIHDLMLKLFCQCVKPNNYSLSLSLSLPPPPPPRLADGIPVDGDVEEGARDLLELNSCEINGAAISLSEAAAIGDVAQASGNSKKRPTSGAYNVNLLPEV